MADAREEAESILNRFVLPMLHRALLQDAIAAAILAAEARGAEAMRERAARVAVGDGPLYVEIVDGWALPGSPYDKGRADAAAAIRALPTEDKSNDR